MYLKEITATGFKSFADKISIELNGKTTCIVGPNGSGKSNIVDAVRWVLGEQSVKSLRGDNNMSDVIFSGSKNRNPLNVATVSLTFDNSDNYINMPYNEITVKRRVYRSGENEYFINNEKCRLKDVTELFLDTGIGKSSFNIISQGEIQKIISDSSYDRRVIFESASGVLKYKRRKEEAIRKLEKTKNNMERVDDIIAELEIQVEPLKEQSEKAKEYLDVKEKLENIEVALLANEITSINVEREKNKTRINTLNNEIMNLNVLGSKSDTELLDYKNDLSKIEEEIRTLNIKLLSLTKEEEKVNGDLKILKERSKYDSSNDKVHQNIFFLKEEKLRIENSIHLLETELDNLNSDLNRVSSDVNSYTLQLNNERNNQSKLYNDLNNKKIEISDIEHKISVTVDFINNGGTTNNSIKSIISNPRIKGVHGTLGSVLSTEEEYIKALDIALSSTKQFIIVDDESVAKNAINYLRDNNLGRATFFPLNVIKPRGIDLDSLDLIKRDSGFISIMSDIVSYDKTYYNIISNQLGNVVLVDNIDSANRISKLINQKYKIVTLLGDVVHVGGTISGGSVASIKNIFSEKHELEVLKSRKIEISEAIELLENNINEKTNIINSIELDRNNKQVELISLNEIISSKTKSLSELKENLDNVQSELSGLDAVTNSSISKEEDKIMNRLYEAKREKDDSLLKQKTLQKEKDRLTALIDEIESSNKLNNSTLYAYEKELKGLEISLSKMDSKLDNNLLILSEDYSLTYERARDNYELDMEFNEAKNLVNKYKIEIKNIGMVNLQAIEDYKRVSERYDFLTSQKNDLINARDTLLEIINEMDTVMKEEFSSTFEKIKVEFEKVFKKLFGGGSATLKLTNPKDMLETGVDIVASPPGKKLTSINLLSGGEKTLTAICLIFSILNVKTIPFCLFDEIEAALDEANVDNFGKYLDNYREKTQFLIITHKKKTMEYADTLYGITMQESGVSKLVSVKLENIKN